MSPEEPDPSERQLVLVVDDDADVRTLVSHALTAAGFEVLLASDGRQALQVFEARDPDAVVSDLMMPGLDGYHVILQIRSLPDPRRASVPIVILSGRSQPSDIARGWAIGASDYLTKPFDPDVLVARLRAVLEARQS